MLRKKSYFARKNIILDPTQTFFAPFFLIFLTTKKTKKKHIYIHITITSLWSVNIEFQLLGERLQLKWLLFPLRYHQTKLAQNYKSGHLSFPKIRKENSINLLKLTIQLLNWEFGIIVRTESVWLEVINNILPPARKLTQALLTYVIIVWTSTFLAAELSFTKPFFFSCFARTWQKSVANIAIASRF